MDESLQIHSPLFLFTSQEPCWKCGTLQLVTGIATPRLIDGGETIGRDGVVSEPIFLTNIESMPDDVFAYVARRNPQYMKRYSRTAGSSYFANTCTCGANFGDHYLYAEPSGAFFPEDEVAARLIRYRRMPFEGVFPFQSGYSRGLGAALLAHVREETTGEGV